jgi:hypothetical protein
MPIHATSIAITLCYENAVNGCALQSVIHASDVVLRKITDEFIPTQVPAESPNAFNACDVAAFIVRHFAMHAKSCFHITYAADLADMFSLVLIAVQHLPFIS